jgi:hypothetical protein
VIGVSGRGVYGVSGARVTVDGLDCVLVTGLDDGVAGEVTLEVGNWTTDVSTDGTLGEEDG